MFQTTSGGYIICLTTITYKIYFTKNLSKNQEKIHKKGGKSFKPPTLYSFLISKESFKFLKIKHSKQNFESFSPDS